MQDIVENPPFCAETETLGEKDQDQVSHSFVPNLTKLVIFVCNIDFLPFLLHSSSF
jgi:hypothetical protein